MATKGKYVDNHRRRASLGLVLAPVPLLAVTIRAVMKQRGLSQRAVAEFVSVSQKTVSDWCVGAYRPRGLNFTLLASCLGVSEKFLMTYEPAVIAMLSRAIRPGEFLSEAGETALREAERYAREAPLREAATQREAARQHEAALLQESEDRRSIRQTLRDPAMKGDWRRRVAMAGNRCMFCATPLRHPGICAACMSGVADEE